MKKVLFFAMAGALLASCASDEFDGQDVLETGAGEINFSMNIPAVTRSTSIGGAEAAARLNNNFIVYGFKNESGQEEDFVSAANDKLVMEFYNVSYTANTANTTKSNKYNWEYVGNWSAATTSVKQTIKYWDYSAARYVFSAVSGTGFTVSKIKTAAKACDKGWELTIPQGGSISDLYASNRKEMKKSKGTDGKNTYGDVKFDFYSLITKVRFGFYEIVDGYNVKIDKFYYTDGDEETSETNFAVTGTFKSLKNDGPTVLTVTYDDSNKPILTLPSEVETTTYKLFGTNLQTKTSIGTASNEATYDQDGGAYTCILPYQSRSLSTPTDNILTLKLDYTLVSTDGSNEEIKVKGATASIPSEYTQWKNNNAYTYLFKISDNTGGTTGDPTDPDDPKGLYPIVFDACVIAEGSDIQETVTSESETSITTYQAGEIVTANNEYKAGKIYYTAMKSNSLQDISSSNVYEIYYSGTTALTEGFVKNYANNPVSLIKLSTTKETSVAGSTFDDKKCYSFQAEDNKTYAINCGDGWKVVKVGDATKSALTISAPTATISAKDGNAVIKLVKTTGSCPVVGAINKYTITNSAGNDVTKNFTITDGDNEGEYKIALTTEAIAAGANDTYTVKFDTYTTTFTVNITYELDKYSVTITAGNTTGIDVTLTIGGTATDGTVTDKSEGLTVAKQSDGKYKVTAAATMTKGTYSVKIGGQTLTVNVDKYAFTPSSLELNKKESGETTGNITLQKNGETASTVKYDDLIGKNNEVATGMGNNGVYTIKAVKAGTYTLLYDNSSVACKVTVNTYSLTAGAGSISKTTGSTTLTLKKNNGSESQVKLTGTADFEVYKDDAKVTSGYSLTASDGKLKFASVSEAGTYKIKYKVGSDVVAIATITVN